MGGLGRQCTRNRMNEVASYLIETLSIIGQTIELLGRLALFRDQSIWLHSQETSGSVLTTVQVDPIFWINYCHFEPLNELLVGGLPSLRLDRLCVTGFRVWPRSIIKLATLLRRVPRLTCSPFVEHTKVRAGHDQIRVMSR